LSGACLANMELTLLSRYHGLWAIIVSVSSSVLGPVLVPAEPASEGLPGSDRRTRISSAHCTPYPRIALAPRSRRRALYTLGSGARLLSLICLRDGHFPTLNSVSRVLTWKTLVGYRAAEN
jgi:hypothetical protein